MTTGFMEICRVSRIAYVSRALMSSQSRALIERVFFCNLTLHQTQTRIHSRMKLHHHTTIHFTIQIDSLLLTNSKPPYHLGTQSSIQPSISLNKQASKQTNKQLEKKNPNTKTKNLSHSLDGSGTQDTDCIP